MISTAESVRRIEASPAPVLLSDTCSLLDLIREPFRDGFTAAHVEAATRLLARAEARPQTLWIALTRQVLTELDDNRAAIEQGAEAAIVKFEEAINRARAIVSAHGIATTAPNLVAASLPSVAQRLVQRFVDASAHLSFPRGVEARAMARISRNIAPAQRGQQAKDCLVLESYLALVRALRAKGLAIPIVFLTTNTNDYSDRGNRAVLHPTLAAEFDGLQLGYAVNFAMAEHLLR